MINNIKNLMRNFIICAAIFLLIPISVFASGKEIEVPLDKDYNACAFNVATEEYGYFDITVISPKGQETYGKIEGGNSTDVLVKDVKKGTWTVKVAKADSNIASSTESSDEEVNESSSNDNSSSSIGKVKVSVRGIDVSSYTIDDDIKVAKDIAGLKMYFKDDNIEVEWSDTSAGNVVVTVTDTLTNVEIGKETVKGNSFECAIPELTKQITVTVVPSTSTNVVGASNQYTLTVDNHPNATVSYENKEYVNTNTIPISVELRDSYSLQFVVNGALVDTVEEKSAGTYDFDIPVVEGNNTVLTYVVDSDGNMRSTSYEVIRDSVTPELKLDVAYDGRKTYETNVYFSGYVSDFNYFSINGVDVNVSGDGYFKQEYELHEGDNKIVFKASDLAGNETVYEATVTKLIEEKKEIPWIPIISGVFVIIVLIVVLIKKYNDPGNGKYNNLIDGIKEKREENKQIKEKKEVTIKEPKKRKFNVSLNEWQRFGIEVLCFVVLCFVVFRLILVPGVTVSESMEPTIMTGDWGFTNRLAYIINEPQRGDIITFYGPDGKVWTKRIIGLPGETISFYDGYVYINDGLIYEEYISSDVETNSATKDFIIPDGCYFVMGDNRLNSYDSRAWSDPYIKKSSIKGKYMTTLFNINSFKK